MSSPRNRNSKLFRRFVGSPLPVVDTAVPEQEIDDPTPPKRRVTLRYGEAPRSVVAPSRRRAGWYPRGGSCAN